MVKITNLLPTNITGPTGSGLIQMLIALILVPKCWRSEAIKEVAVSDCVVRSGEWTDAYTGLTYTQMLLSTMSCRLGMHTIPALQNGPLFLGTGRGTN